MYCNVAYHYTKLKLLDQQTKNKVTELLVLSKAVSNWRRYSQQRKSLRIGLALWKKNASKRRNLRIKFNLLFLVVAVTIKWKRFVVARKNLRAVVSLLQSSICSICYSSLPNFISRCKHTFCKKCISKWLGIKNTCTMCRFCEIVKDGSLPVTVDDVDED